MTRKERVAAIVEYFMHWSWWIRNRIPGWSTDEELADQAYDYLRALGVDTPGVTPDAAKHARQKAGIWWPARRKVKTPDFVGMAEAVIDHVDRDARTTTIFAPSDVKSMYEATYGPLGRDEAHGYTTPAPQGHPDMIDDDAEREGNIAAAILDLARSVRFLADAIDGRDVK